MSVNSLMYGNILDALDAGTITVVGHQVNTRGQMSHGLARQIRERYPLAYTAYRDALRDHTLVLGGICPVEVAPDHWIVHMAGQRRAHGWPRQKTDYVALTRALVALNDRSARDERTVALPYGLGCGLGGGQWPVVSALIAAYCSKAVLARIDNL